jgi:hypothetical protein
MCSVPSPYVTPFTCEACSFVRSWQGFTEVGAVLALGGALSLALADGDSADALGVGDALGSVSGAPLPSGNDGDALPLHAARKTNEPTRAADRTRCITRSSITLPLPFGLASHEVRRSGQQYHTGGRST